MTSDSACNTEARMSMPTSVFTTIIKLYRYNEIIGVNYLNNETTLI